MKKTLILCLAFGAILFSACSNKTSKGDVANDSTAVADTVANSDSLQATENQETVNGDASKTAAQEIPDYWLTAQGVGAIIIGANINKLPKSIEGLYDKVAVKSEYNEVEDENTTTATFTKKGKEVMTAMADDNGKITYIGVSSKDVAVKVGDAYFKVGSSVKELLKAKGVKKDESYAAVYNGIQFNQDASGKIYDMSIGSAW